MGKMILGIGALALAACGTAYQAQTIPTGDPELAYRESIRAMAAHGQSIENKDPLVGLVLGAWSHYPSQGAEYRIRIVTDADTVVSIDCRNRVTRAPCSPGVEFPGSLVQTAKAIGADLRAN